MTDAFAGALPWRKGECAAAVDIGSNSVRLLVIAGGRNEKYVETTRLASGLAEAGLLQADAVERTAQAAARFAAQAKIACGGVFLFATEAVRRAANRDLLLDRIYELCGERVTVLSGEEEAVCGFLGTADGVERVSVLDIGGASAELVTGQTAIEGSVSLPVGTVRLFDTCGRDRARIDETLFDLLAGYESVPRAQKLLAIGGTATCLASVLAGLRRYERAKVHGFVIGREARGGLCDRLFSLSVEEIRALPGMDPRRADVIAGGAELLLRFLERFGYGSAQVSETDNLEGFLRSRERIV